MRVNVYAEEMSDHVEVISKTTADGTFTGLRIFLELPVTVIACTKCGALEPATTIKRIMSDEAALVPVAEKFCRDSGDGVHRFRPRQISGPFMHRPGDDDSSAVTFWGKQDLRGLLRKMSSELKKFYGDRDVELVLSEEERQMVLLALAVLSLESPGFDDMLNKIALRIDNRLEKIDSIQGDRDRAEVYESFRESRRKPIGHGG